MRNSNRGIFATIENYIDMVLNALAIYIAYFFVCLFRTPTMFPNTPEVVIWILVFVILCGFTYQIFDVYKLPAFPRRGHAGFSILRANLAFYGAVAVLASFFGDGEEKQFTLLWVLLTFFMSTSFLNFKRRVIIRVLMAVRHKQYVVHKVLLVGDNTAAIKEYVNQISANPQYGMMILGYIGRGVAEEDVGCDRLGDFNDFSAILDEHNPTEVVFAIDAYNKRNLINLVNICDDRCIKVFFLPVIFGFFKSPKQIDQVGSLPIINIHTTPLDNKAKAFLKRAVDIVGSLLLIIATSPIMLAAAIGVKITSPEGPILFKQERVGKMGKPFIMLKFRSMRPNPGDGWTTNNDPRKTRFGTFLRRTAIDELPQLFNVLSGSMSLVGPRPELPKFVEQFKKYIPLYMVKHYVKPGITGLAQIKGLRGDTSVEDRIHEDIFYIEQWSIWLDLYILLKTPLKAFNKNEKYVPAQDDKAEPSYPELMEIDNVDYLDDENFDADKVAQVIERRALRDDHNKEMQRKSQKKHEKQDKKDKKEDNGT